MLAISKADIGYYILTKFTGIFIFKLTNRHQKKRRRFDFKISIKIDENQNKLFVILNLYWDFIQLFSPFFSRLM